MLSKGEIQVLNAARSILKATREEAGRGRWDAREAGVGEPDSFDWGYLSAAADHAEESIFGVLNIARSYCHFDISDEDMHMRQEEVESDV
jgi:hypothetical protein